MRVSIEVPQYLADELTTIATAKDMRVGDLVVSMLTASTARQPMDARVIQGVLNGKADRDIAADTGLVVERVRIIRRRYNIPGNRKHRTWKEDAA